MQKYTTLPCAFDLPTHHSIICIDIVFVVIAAYNARNKSQPMNSVNVVSMYCAFHSILICF